jgi:hypothetical protein
MLSRCEGLDSGGTTRLAAQTTGPRARACAVRAKWVTGNGNSVTANGGPSKTLLPAGLPVLVHSLTPRRQTLRSFASPSSASSSAPADAPCRIAASTTARPAVKSASVVPEVAPLPHTQISRPAAHHQHTRTHTRTHTRRPPSCRSNPKETRPRRTSRSGRSRS